MKEFRYEIIKDYKMYDVFSPMVKKVNGLKYNTTYTGKENIPTEGRFILACNHHHTLDPFVAAVGVQPRAVHFMSKKENFPNGAAQFVMTRMNAFPIERGKADYKAMKHAIKLLEAGLILGIFPEGTRSETGEFGEPKNGAVYLALKTKSDILPTSLLYDDGGEKPIKTTIRYGKIIKFEDLNLPEKPTKAQMKAASEFVMSKIKELYDLGHNI